MRVLGRFNRQMSSDEASIVLGAEGGAEREDSAIMVAYDEYVSTF